MIIKFSSASNDRELFFADQTGELYRYFDSMLSFMQKMSGRFIMFAKTMVYMTDSRFAPSQWEMSLQGLRPANERHLYRVTPSLIDWAQK